MKLKENQLNLIRHLAQYEVLDYLSCLQALDETDGKDRKALSYAFRPLTKNNYLSRRKDGSVAILAKGQALIPKQKPLITTGGGAAGLARTLSVSRTALWLQRVGVESYGQLQNTNQPYFIPSACWRKIRPGILSTTRFAGMLLFPNHRLAVYDIGDGAMDWQMKAERSLFYQNYGNYDTKATGMLLICEDSKGKRLSEQIIRQTMWQRKQLIGTQSSYERNRPVQYIRAPVRLAWYYERVYLSEQSDLKTRLHEIMEDDIAIAQVRQQHPSCQERKQGDFEDWPYRYFVNFAGDLLKYIYFFTAAKSLLHLREAVTYVPELKYRIIVQRRDLYIFRIYEDVLNAEGVEFLVFTN